MAKKILLLSLLFLICSLSSTKISPYSGDEFNIWWVGQGQWTTLHRNEKCLHFDMGGEWAPFSKIERLCANKQNYIFISHRDFDHIRFEKKWRYRWGHTIQQENLEFVKEVYSGCKNCFVRNEKSKVFLVLNSILLPGDGSKKSEKKWIHKVRHQPKIFLLGHHGSNTSNGLKIANKLHPLAMSIASARKVKYGHPHAKIIQTWSSQGRIILRTEIWGNLRFKL